MGVESGDEAMLKRIRKDITLPQVFKTAEHMRELGIAGIFPFIVGFPEETDASVRATIDAAKRLRAMSPDFETPIFYFKPYPGSAIVLEAVDKGFRLPDSSANGRSLITSPGAGSLGDAGEVRADRAVQVLPGTRLEACFGGPWTVAAGGPLPLPA